MELTDSQKAEKFAALNIERRAKIKAVIGKSKEGKLEKERKKYMTKNTDDKDSAWLNEVVAVNNK